MLLELKVSNLAIIDNVHIQFRTGLNILSGETGAGKSILLKSLGLLMGEKALADSIRTGADAAIVEGSFDLSDRPDVRDRLVEMGIEVHDDVLVVRRIISTQNKSRVYLNGSLSTLGGLRDVVYPLVEVAGHSVPLIEMTGQHENRSLLSLSYHLDLLDQYTGAWKQRTEFAEKFKQLKEITEQIESLRQEDRNRAQRLDFLLYQRDEIKALGLKPGEEEELEQETKRLKHSTRLSEFIEQTENLLYGEDDSVTGRLHYVLQRANELKKLDASLAEVLEPLSQAKTLIAEVSYDLRDYSKSLEGDPSRLDELESRLSSLRQLQKKYGTTVEEILQTLEEIEKEVALLQNSDDILQDLEVQKKKLESRLEAMAKELHQFRENGARVFAESVNEELKDLNMKGLTFKISVEKAATMTSTGLSHVEFLTQTSKSDAPRPLAKFASGGELSRILLSIKQVVGTSQFPRTYLFDEVDAGVSGLTAQKVGHKLKTIASGQQVICVTHLPQVACYGNVHFYIFKATGKGKSVNTEVVELKKAERINEIARLISGEKITKTSLAHAEQLITEAQA